MRYQVAVNMQQLGTNSVLLNTVDDVLLWMLKGAQERVRKMKGRNIHQIQKHCFWLRLPPGTDRWRSGTREASLWAHPVLVLLQT